jgi:uncharacterized membrane protein YphA (DoxX/SURF4 family)
MRGARHRLRYPGPRTQRLEESMSIFETSRSPWTGRVLSIFRIVAGLVFITEGTMKLFNYPPAPVPGFPAHFPSEMAVAGVIETFGA